MKNTIENCNKFLEYIKNLTPDELQNLKDRYGIKHAIFGLDEECELFYKMEKI